MKRRNNSIVAEAIGNIALGIAATAVGALCVVGSVAAELKTSHNANRSTTISSEHKTKNVLPEKIICVEDRSYMYGKVMNQQKLVDSIPYKCHTIEIIGGDTYYFNTDGKIRKIVLTDYVINFEYDSSGRISKVRQPIGPSVNFYYDSFGRLSNETSGIYSRYFKYDSFGRLLKVWDNKNYWEKFTYRYDGKLLTEEYSNGHKIKYYYDAYGDLVDKLEI